MLGSCEWERNSRKNSDKKRATGGAKYGTVRRNSNGVIRPMFRPLALEHEVLRVKPVGDRELFQYATRHLSVRFASVVRSLLHRKLSVSERERDGREGSSAGQGDGRRGPGRERAPKDHRVPDARQAADLPVRSVSSDTTFLKQSFRVSKF